MALFLLLATITIAGAFAAMAMRNAVHGVLALAVGLVGVAALYLELGAQFVGFTQVLVYVGAVAILAVFAIMTTQTRVEESGALQSRFNLSNFCGVLIAAGVFAVLVFILKKSGIGATPVAHAANISVEAIGTALMNSYPLPLEAIGLLLTAAMVGSVIVAMPEKAGKP